MNVRLAAADYMEEEIRHRADWRMKKALAGLSATASLARCSALCGPALHQMDYGPRGIQTPDASDAG